MPDTEDEDLTQVPKADLVERIQENGRQADALRALNEPLVAELSRRAAVEADARATLAAMESED